MNEFAEEFPTITTVGFILIGSGLIFLGKKMLTQAEDCYDKSGVFGMYMVGGVFFIAGILRILGLL